VPVPVLVLAIFSARGRWFDQEEEGACCRLQDHTRLAAHGSQGNELHSRHR